LKVCPLCKRQLEDLLKHLVIVHEIEDADQFSKEIEKLEANEERKREFAAYVMQLQQQRTKGLISAEEYRAKIANWTKDQQ
jgi:hypothetical protein